MEGEIVAARRPGVDPHYLPLAPRDVPCAPAPIEACLGAVPDRLYHMRIRSAVSRSTLADANEKRNWRIYEAFAQV
jgi:hypothetical protein